MYQSAGCLMLNATFPRARTPCRWLGSADTEQYSLCKRAFEKLVGLVCQLQLSCQVSEPEVIEILKTYRSKGQAGPSTPQEVPFSGVIPQAAVSDFLFFPRFTYEKLVHTRSGCSSSDKLLVGLYLPYYTVHVFGTNCAMAIDFLECAFDPSYWYRNTLAASW